MIKKSILCSFAFLLVLFSTVLPMSFEIGRFCEISSINNEFLAGVSTLDTVDSEYSFVGSSLIFPIRLYSSTPTQSQTIRDVSIKSGISLSYFSMSFSFSTTGVDIYRYGTSTASNHFDFNSTDMFTWIGIPILAPDFSTGYVNILCNKMPAFNFNVVRFGLMSSSSSSGGRTDSFVSLIYVDDNNYTLRFDIYSGDSAFVSNLYPLRYYYLLPNNFTDNDYYQSGYQAGQSFGFSSGESSGYDKGYNAARPIFYQNGYNDGVESANTYTFLGLIGAVFDAPLNTFTSLLNFDILGFNMLSAFTGLLTLAVIIFFIRLIMGRK